MTTLTPFNSRDPVNETKGGTNQSSFTSGDMLYASGSNTLSKLAIGSSNQILQSNGSIPVWTSVAIPNSTQNLSIYEEFFSASANNGSSNSLYGWTYNNVPTEAAPTSAHPGVVQISVTSNNTYMKLGDNHFVFGQGQTIIDWVIKLGQTSNGTDRFVARVGMMDGTTGNPSNGVLFSYVDNVNSGKWVIEKWNGGAQSTANTNSTADTNWHRFRIIVSADAGTINYYIDGVEVTGSPLTTATTNFVTPRLSINTSLGSASKTISADLMWLQYNISTVRN